MNAGHVDISGASATFTGYFDGLLESFFNPLKLVVKIKSTPFFESHFQMYRNQRRGNTAARYRLNNGIPYIGSEEG
jgi:hypothetical protein